MGIEDSPGVCPICFKMGANDEEIEKCIKSHKEYPDKIAEILNN